MKDRLQLGRAIDATALALAAIDHVGHKQAAAHVQYAFDLLNITKNEPVSIDTKKCKSQ